MEHIKKKPINIVFLDPILFLTIELNGANTIYAAAKTERINDIYVSYTFVPSSLIYQSLFSQKDGKNEATFYTIILPIPKANKHENKIYFFTEFVN